MTHNPPQLDAATAMMLAADYVEQEGRYYFMACHVPRTCQDVGCVLGWIGYVLGGEDEYYDAPARRIGYSDEFEFYHEMHRVCAGVLWQEDAALAATGLRKLARERME